MVAIRTEAELTTMLVNVRQTFVVATDLRICSGHNF
jgi:hypothetical protein